MPVIGIQNFDRMMKKVELMEKACGEKVRDEALAAAGDVLADALSAVTPVRTSTGGLPPGRYKGRYGNYWTKHAAGMAKRSVINVPAKSKAYGVTRRLVGYSKDAYYMLWVEKGHRLVRGGRISRKAHKNELGGQTHSQGGKGREIGSVAGRKFMDRVFKSNIKLAMEAAKAVIRRAAQGQTASQGKVA